MNSAKSAHATTVLGRAFVFAASLVLVSSISSSIAATSASVSVSTPAENRGKLGHFLRRKCGACHGAKRNRAVPNVDVLDLDNPKYTVMGKHSESLLWQRVSRAEMPPPRLKPLDDAEKQELAQLIDSPQRELRTIIETARSDKRFSELLRYAEVVGLAQMLKPGGPYTILAPTNEAFRKLPPDELRDLEKNRLKLSLLLINHGVRGKRLADRLEKDGKATAISGLVHTVRRKGERLYIGKATVVERDIECSDGVIHAIDQIYISTPPTKTMVNIRGGQFVMGSVENDENQQESPQRNVRISPFLIGAFEVTRGTFFATMKWDPSYDDEEYHLFKDWTDKRPVQRVTWMEAVEFCNALSQSEGFSEYYRIKRIDGRDTVTIPRRNGNGYRLPTEAEWEYACRAGSPSDYCFGAVVKTLDNFAWHRENVPKLMPQPVGQKTANKWGLYDMHGNVEEWCQDWYGPYQPSRNPGALIDPTGPSEGEDKVKRGGSYFWWTSRCRSASRSQAPLDYKHGSIGFRIARTPQRGEAGKNSRNQE
jgi:formylglycine-generating enzyme required for sulfatase activity/uncharacterized surface protein with fasciclin (FAS1) repeats